MRAPILAAIAAGVLLLAMTGGPGPAGAQMMQRFETDTLVIETGEGTRHRFTVELATTPEQRAQGLMYRRELAADHGMLFIYARSRHIAMWMKNTFIPLDMLFIDRRGRVARIAERTVPHSLRTIQSGEPVLAVLEVPGGTADRLGLAPGDRVRHDAFAGAGAE